MKKFLKLAIIPAAFIAVGMTTSCNINPKEVALITDVGDIDDGSFNQSSWEAIKDYCTTNNKTFDYYRPFADSDFARRCAIKQAVYKGAKIIICPGFKFASAVTQAQKDYKDRGIHFLLMDSETTETILPNTCCVGYNCEVSGYLAGYSVAYDYMMQDLDKDGKLKDNYNFGYCGGMANDGVLQFGFGMIQGIVHATEYVFNEKWSGSYKNWPDINVRFKYAGVFGQSDDAATAMKSWYANDYKCVFACGGKLYQSVVEGVKDYNRKNGHYDNLKEGSVSRDAARWIGVDSDQYLGLNGEANKHARATLYTSALKGLNPTIQTVLDYHYGVGGKNFEQDIGGPAKDHKMTGQTANQWILGLSSKLGDKDEGKDYVGIPEVYDSKTQLMRGFNKFSYDNYKELKKAVASNISVYSGNGLDVKDKNGDLPTTDEEKTKRKGNPTFMSDSKNYFIGNTQEANSYYKKYFSLYSDSEQGKSNIPAEKISCSQK